MRKARPVDEAGRLNLSATCYGLYFNHYIRLYFFIIAIAVLMPSIAALVMPPA